MGNRTVLPEHGGLLTRPIILAFTEEGLLYLADKAADWKAACDSAEAASKEITRLKLTRYERHCIERVRDTYADEDDVACNEIAAVLDGLLERTK